jgi:GINS complex subunit 2
MTTAESEFFAEETLITISPNFSHPKLLFTSGSFGPLEAGDPCVVPLWLAITLRKRGKCIIVIPEWMSVASLEQNILNEKSDEHFEPLQFHYKEISQLLLNYARDDVKEPDRVSALLQDIENIRMDRAKMGMLGILLNSMDPFTLTVCTQRSIFNNNYIFFSFRDGECCPPREYYHINKSEKYRVYRDPND